MEPFRYHVYICTQKKPEGAPSCTVEGAEAVLMSLRKSLAEEKLLDQVQVTTSGCLGICERGPNMVVYPESIWYTQIKPEQMPRIVKEHFKEGTPVSEWTLQDMDAAKKEITEHRQRMVAMQAAMEKSGAMPDELSNLIRGYTESRITLTAVELDLFTAVGDGSSAEEVATTLNTDKRATESLMNALTAMELLIKEGDIFRNSSVAKKYLIEGAEFDSRTATMHSVDLWHKWSTLTDCVKMGTSVARDADQKQDEANTKAFIAAMHKGASARAMQIVSSMDLENVHHILDLGGGSGAYSMAFARKNDTVKCTVFDLPAVIPLTREYVKKEGLSDRIDFLEGDMISDALGSGYDLVWISSICHMFGPDENRDLLRRVYQSLNSGGQIVIQDFILNDEKTKPRAGAVFALNMLVNTKAGSSYSRREYSSWLEEAGFTQIDLKPMPGPIDQIVARKP